MNNQPFRPLDKPQGMGGPSVNTYQPPRPTMSPARPQGPAAPPPVSMAQPMDQGMRRQALQRKMGGGY